jgi:hypothetical protein
MDLMSKNRTAPPSTSPPRILKLDMTALGLWRRGTLPSTDIFVIDNFWPNPKQLRRTALQAQFSREVSPSGFEFFRAPPDRRQVWRAVDLLARFVGTRAASFMNNSYFVYEGEQEESSTRKRVWVHFDPWLLVGVLYLNEPQQCHGGTVFYAHRNLGFSRVPTNFDVQEYDGLDTLLTDTNDSRAWTVLEHVDMRWNRLILFNPSFFHSPECYFGKSKEDSRLYQVFLFD